MRLQSKILLSLLLLMVVFACLDYAVLRVFVLQSVLRIEHDAAIRDMARCRLAWQNEIEHLAAANATWASSDGIGRFVATPDPDYIQSNLAPRNFRDKGINVVCIYDPAGQLVWGRALDLITENEIDLPPFLGPSLGDESPMMIRRADGAIDGVMVTEPGPLLLSVRPILTTGPEGPVGGVMAIGRFFDDRALCKLERLVRVNLRLRPLAADEQAEERLSGTETRRGIVVHVTDSNWITARSTVYDMEGHPALVMEARIFRDILASGQAAYRYGLLAAVVAGTVLLGALFAVVNYMVIRPIQTLTRNVIAVSEATDMTGCIALSRRDEIGVLSREFEALTERLRDMNRKRIDQSFTSVSSEKASAAVHGIRNAMTPLMLGLDLFRDDLLRVDVETARQALAGLDVGAVKPDSACRAVGALAGFVRTVIHQRDNWLEQVGKLSAQIRRVGSLLEGCRGSRQAVRPLERINLRDHVKEVIAALPDEARNNLAIEVDPALTQTDDVLADYSRLSLIIVNLLVNAVEAVRMAGREQATIRVSGHSVVTDGQNMAALSFRDNGCGIAPDNVDRIFERGYSTKPEGGKGLGLCWCAGAMAGMNGRIEVVSDGVGQGACFTLLLPVAPGPEDRPAQG